VLYGEVTNDKNRSLPDLSPREAAVLLPLVALSLFMGVASPVFTRRIEPAANNLIQQVKQRSRVGAPAPASEADPLRSVRSTRLGSAPATPQERP
jgi:NADH-quinone oxidoreductase subunit M